MRKFLLFLMVFCSLGYFSQGQNYSFTSATGASLIDMSAGTTGILSSGNDDTPSGVALIGFNFPFYGINYSQFSVSPDGFLKLGSVAAVSQYTNSITSTTNIPKLYPYWDDLATGTDGYAKYKVIGDAPNRVFVMEWKVTIPRNTSGASNTILQALLYETTGVIEYIYGTVASGGSYSVGLTNSGTQYASVTTSSHTVSYSSANNSNSSAIVSGLKYTFTPPPPCSVPPDPATALTFPTIAKTSLGGSFTAAAGGADKYLVVRSLSSSLSANPVNATTYAVGASLGGGVVDYYGNLTTFTSSNLFPGTTYYYFIFSANDLNCIGGPIYKTDVILTGNQATQSPANIESAVSGPWSAPATWVGGVVPTSADNAVIKSTHTVTIDASTNTCLNLTVENGASLTYGTGTTYKLTVWGNAVNDGTIDFYDAAGTIYCDLTFSGAYNSTFTGAGFTDVSTITMNKGTSRNNILEMTMPNFTAKNLSTDALAFLTITNGTFKFSGTNAFTGNFFTPAAYSIPANGGFWLNNANVTVNGQNGSPTLTGMLRITNGTYRIGTSAGNSMGLASNSSLIVEGGSIIAASRIAVSSSGNTINFTISGGSILVNTVGNTSSSVPSFDLGTSTTSVFSMTGGSITLQLANTGTNYDFRGPATGINPIPDISGTTLYLGNANSGTAKTFYVAGNVPPLVITTTSATHNLGLAGNVYYHGNMTVPGGSVFKLNNGAATPTGYGIWCKGSVINNGTIDGTVTSSRFDFSNALFGGTTAQTYSGSGLFGSNGTATTNLSLGINNANASGVTFSGPVSTLRVNMFQGNVTGSGNITVGNGVSGACVIQLGVSSATTQGGSFDVAPVFNLGTGTLSVLYTQEPTTRTTGFEIPSTRNVTSVSVNNTNGVILAGGNLTLGSAGALTLTAGNLTTNASNTLILTNTATGAVSGGSATSFVNGPMQRTYAAGRTAVGTYDGSTFFPIGNGTTYLPLYIDPTTTAGGTVTFSGQAFTSNSGTMGPGVLTLSANRWEAPVVAGSANFTSAFLRIGDGALAATNKYLQAATGAGQYSGVATVSIYATGTPATLTMSGTQVPVADYDGFFAYGDLQACVAPAGQPYNFAVGQTTTTSFTGSFTPPDPAASNYLVVRYASGGTPTPPVDYTVYTVGGVLGTGVVRSVSSATVFYESGLTAGTTYDYYIYAYNNSGCYGPVYNLTSPLYAVVSTCATAIGTPGIPTFTNKSSTGFTVSWTASSTAGVGYTIDVATNSTFTNFVSGYNGLYLGEGVLTTNVTGLSANTTYWVRVSASFSTCYSPYASASTTTLCDAYTTFPYLESFSATLPSCWQVYEGTSGASYHWAPSTGAATHGPAAPQSGTHFMWEYVYLSSTAYNPYYLQTPPFAFDPAPKVMKYYYWLGSGGYLGTTGETGADPYPLSVQASTDGGTTWTTIYGHSSANSVFGTTSTSPWTQVTLDLTAYVDMDVMFRFKTMSNYGSNFTDQGLDELRIEDMTPELTVSPTSLNFGYVGSGSSPEQSFILSGRALKGSPGGDITVTGNSNFEVSLNSGGPYSTSVLAPYPAATMPPTTIYARFTPSAPNTVYNDVISNAGGAAPTVNVNVSGSSQLSYCVSAATSTSNEDIFNVQLGTGGSLINNSSDCSTLAPGPGSVQNKYSNYTTSVAAPDIMRGQSYPFSISIGTCDLNTYSGIKIFVDFNQNGLFTDAGEEVYVSSSTTLLPFTATGSFLVPLNATLGQTWMRVVNVESATTSITPCGTYTYGETEDYLVNIINFPAGNIQGNVTDCLYGMPIEGAIITYSLFSTTTNGDGDYLLTDVPIQTGNLTITHDPDYYPTIIPNVTTVLNQTITQDACLNYITCHVPTGVIVPVIGLTSATATWTPSALTPNPEWIVEYGPTGFTHGTGTVAYVATTPQYTMTGLSMSTSYDFYVRTYCAAGDSSTWVGPVTFTTLCGTVAPFEQHFPTTSIPVCWSMTGPQSWLFTTTWPAYGAAGLLDHTTGGGGSFAGVDGSGSTGLTDIALYSIYIDASTLVRPQLRFYMFNNNTQPPNVLNEQSLSVDVWNGTSWVNDVFVWAMGQNAAGWQEQTVDLQTIGITGPIQLRFVVDKGTGSPFYDDMIIDDVYIEEGPTCPKPTALAASNITSTGADISWTSTGTLFDIEYGLAGFAPTGTPTISGVTNPYTLSGLLSGTSYSYYVRSDCGGGDLSGWSGPKTFSTLCGTYALPYTQNFDGMTSVGNNVLPNCWLTQSATGTPWSTGTAGSITYNDPYSAPNYIYVSWSPSATDKFLITPGFDLTSGTSYDFSFQWAGDNYTGWTGDVLYNTTQSGAGATALGASFVVAGTTTPTTYALVTRTFIPTASGVYYFMVKINNDGVPYYLGFDNFKVEVTPSCIAPTALTATSITTNSATLGWTSAGSLFDIELGLAGFTPTGTPTSAGVTNPYNVGSLLPSTSYSYYVRQNCGAGNYSSWEGPYTFMTLCEPVALPFSESFDGAALPLCWSQTSTISPRWSVSVSANAGGVANEMWANWASGTGISRLVTPPINTTGVTDLIVSFKHLFDDYAAGITYKLQSSSDGVTWTDESWSYPSGGGNAGPGTVTTHVMSNLGGTTYIAWVLDGDHYQYDAWYIDDVLIMVQPTIDLAFTDYYQFSGLSAPQNGLNMPVELTNATKDGRFQSLPVGNQGVSATNVNNTRLLNSTMNFDSPMFPGTPIQINAEISNLGLTAASYVLDWTVGGVAQTDYTGPSVPAPGTDVANLTFNPTALGTFITTGHITVTGDEVPSNNTATPFRTRVYPDVFTRTVYDRGDNIVDTYIGWNSLTIAMKAGVRFTAADNLRLAGVDMILRTETAPLGTIIVQVRAAGATTEAPGAVLYTRSYSTADYQSPNGDLIYFPFGTDAPVIAAGSDYWITIKGPLGILFPGGAHNDGFTAGHSYYESQPDTNVWTPLIITTERAWIMRSVNVSAATPPAVFDVTGTGSYCEGATGLTVTLSGSEVDVDYQLKKGGVAFGATIPGTGSPLTWTELLAGTYTVDGTNAGGTTPMNGSAVITEDPLPDDAGVITGPATVTQGETQEYSVAPIANATGYTWSFPAGTVINAGDNTYAVTVTFASTAPGAAVVTVTGTNACGSGVVSPDFNLLVLPACQEPTGVGATTIGLTTATIFWVAPVPAPSDGYDYEVRTSGAPGSGSTGLATSGSTPPGVVTAGITGLTAGTTYFVYVRSNCGDGVYSAWTAAYSFATVPDLLVVSGIVPGGMDTCYNANIITVAGDPLTFVVQENGSAEFIAASKVTFLPGSSVLLGGYMYAHISSVFCGYAPPPIPGALAGEAEPQSVISTALFSIYPNPTNGNFTLVQKGEKTYGTVRVEVFSMKGEKVLTETMIGEKKHEFTFSDLPGGLYFVKVVADGYVETIKLVKTR